MESMMSATVQTLVPAQFTRPILCPKCGQRGSETLERGSNFAQRNPEPQLVQHSDEFYERLAKKPPYPIELVCQRCGAVQRR
jgi:hypothetical protein